MIMHDPGFRIPVPPRPSKNHYDASDMGLAKEKPDADDRKGMCKKMHYRTKAAMKILMELTRKEAFEFLEVLDDVQKKIYCGSEVFPFDKMSKEEAVRELKVLLEDGELEIPRHLKGHLERFLELMINERAPMDELLPECNSALNVLLHYDLFKPDACVNSYDAPSEQDRCSDLKKMKHKSIYKNNQGTEVEIKIKAECPTYESVRRTLSFIAQSSHKFYLEVAEKISGDMYLEESKLVNISPEAKEYTKKKYVPFTDEDAEKLARDGERYASRGFVKAYGFEEAVAFTMSLTRQIWGLLQENKGFRMELHHDSETLNTNYCFFVPIDQCGSDGTSQVSPED